MYEIFEHTADLGLRVRSADLPNLFSEAAEGLCQACYLSLRPQFFQDVRRNEQVLYCESCGRILYFNPPAVVEEAAAGPDVLT